VQRGVTCTRMCPCCPIRPAPLAHTSWWLAVSLISHSVNALVDLIQLHQPFPACSGPFWPSPPQASSPTLHGTAALDLPVHSLLGTRLARHQVGLIRQSGFKADRNNHPQASANLLTWRARQREARPGGRIAPCGAGQLRSRGRRAPLGWWVWCQSCRPRRSHLSNSCSWRGKRSQTRRTLWHRWDEGHGEKPLHERRYLGFRLNPPHERRYLDLPGRVSPTNVLGECLA